MDIGKIQVEDTADFALKLFATVNQLRKDNKAGEQERVTLEAGCKFWSVLPSVILGTNHAQQRTDSVEGFLKQGAGNQPFNRCDHDCSCSSVPSSILFGGQTKRTKETVSLFSQADQGSRTHEFPFSLSLPCLRFSVSSSLLFRLNTADFLFRGWGDGPISNLAKGAHRLLPLHLDSFPLRLQASPHAAQVHHDVPLAARRHRR